MSEFFSNVLEWLSLHRIYAQAAVEVFIIFIFVYAFLRIMQGTRGAGILRGLAIIVAALAVLTILVTRVVKLDNISWIMGTFAPVIIIPMFVLFQPEVRRALIRLGQNPLYRMFFRPHSRFTDELVHATYSLARDKIGGLIAIEREVGLRSYVEGGVRLDAEVSAELIKTIFWPGTPLHDGAIVVRQQRIAAAGCLFPLTDNPQFSAELGTRHRAGIGITEESDAVAIVISEQSGQVSLVVQGRIQRDIGERALRRALEEISAEVAQEE